MAGLLDCSQKCLNGSSEVGTWFKSKYPRAVWIPLQEIQNHQHELPAKDRCFLAVCSTTSDCQKLRDFLISRDYPVKKIYDLSVQEDEEELNTLAASWHKLNAEAPFFGLWKPSDLISYFVNTWKLDLNSTVSDEERVCLDLGSGFGRDLAYLGTHVHPASRWHFIAMDRIPASLNGSSRLFRKTDNAAGTGHSLTRCHMALTKVGQVRACCSRTNDFDIEMTCKKTQYTSILPWNDYLQSVGAVRLDIVLIIRYLPPRSLIPDILNALKPGGFFVCSTFCEDGNEDTWFTSSLNSESPKFTHPSTREHILEHHELTRLLQQSNQDFDILLDEIHYLPDQRPYQWFVARRTQ